MVEQSSRTMRRAHKKSRKGCLECKRRHIRCDEKRPHCVNCARAERTCSYPGAPPAPSQPGTSGHASGASTPDGYGDGVVDGNGSGHGSRTNPGNDQATDGGHEVSSVNLTHLKLFHHLLYLLRQVADHEPAIGQLDLDAYVEAAMKAPYLMHAALAFSARHLSITEASEDGGGGGDGGRAEFYQNQATALQTRAIRLFNAPLPALNRENGLAVFLFSNLIGIHTLSDALLALHRDEDDDDDDDDELAPFLRRFVDAVKLHRGVKTVAAGCWPLLLQTELHPVLEWGREATAGKGRGDHLGTMRRCLAEAELGDEERRDCQQALDHLQWAVDDDDSSGQQQQPSSLRYLNRQTRMVFSWPIIVSPLFVEMLDQHRGEALAVLACYGAVLHHCERLWLVGQAGRRVVHLIASALGPAWASSLSWPLGVVGGTPPSDLDSPAAGQT